MDEIETTEFRCTDYAELKSSTCLNDEQIDYCIELGIINPAMIGDTQYYCYDPVETDRAILGY